jgi:hypothetical protein
MNAIRILLFSIVLPCLLVAGDIPVDPIVVFLPQNPDDLRPTINNRKYDDTELVDWFSAVSQRFGTRDPVVLVSYSNTPFGRAKDIFDMVSRTQPNIYLVYITPRKTTEISQPLLGTLTEERIPVWLNQTASKLEHK